MNEKPLYLRPNVVFEPLVNSWYAWSFLIAPLHMGLVTRNLHLRVLESYLRAPRQHQMAVRNKALRGGMFVDHDGPPEVIEALVESTRTELEPLLRLADDWLQLVGQVQEAGNGDSIEAMYEQLPESLRGCVELGYDLCNQPRIRLIESLMYAHPCYDQQLQSMSLTLGEGDSRPFVLSSPRLESDDNVMIHMPFSDPRWDRFFALRHSPLPLEEVQQLLPWADLSPAKQSLLQSMLTPHMGEQRYHAPAQGEVRVRYFGHATVLLETAEVSVLTDPIVSYDMDSDAPRFSFADLPERIDYVVITHNHQDHVMLETLLQLRHRIGTIIVPRDSGGELQDPSLRLMLNAVGFKNVREVAEMESVPVSGGAICGLPFLGEHGDLHVLSKLAFHVSLHGETFLFAADSNNLDPRLYARIHAMIGNIDHVFIGMECAGAPVSWVYGPLFSQPLPRKQDQARRLNGSDADRALELVRQFNPRSVYVYAMGAEPWLTFISSIEYEPDSAPIVESDRLIQACRADGLVSERLYGSKELRFQAIRRAA